MPGETKALPQPSPLSAPYWQAAPRGASSCSAAPVGHRQLIHARVYRCASERGRDGRWPRPREELHVIRARSAAYEPELPYVVALIRLPSRP
jgi:hypothetical protein